MEWLKQTLVNMLRWIGELFVNVFTAAWNILVDIFSWVFAQLLDIVLAVVSGINVSALNGVTGWGALPSEILNVMGLLGIGEASAIIVTAIGIRLILQLIPFTRLGS